jgi:hypothetical protein
MPTQGKGKRPPIDWEAVEKEFRAGQLSVRAIASAHGVAESAVRKRAQRDGWARALADKVRNQVKERLTRLDGAQDGAQAQRTSDADIIEAASLRGLAVVTSHRKDLEQLHALKRIILTRLAAHLNGEPIEGPFMGDKETPGDLVEKLSRVTSRLIPLERQAHNLDDDSGNISGNFKVSPDGAFAELVGKLEGVARSATANNPAAGGLAGNGEA